MGMEMFETAKLIELLLNQIMVVADIICKDSE